TDTPYLLDGYGVLGKSSLFFFVDQSITYDILLMWIRRILQSQAMVLRSSKSLDTAYLSRMRRRIDVRISRLS
ncbi:hypothetical protein Tco_1351100, partial [Tanacetum coccineum]